MAHHKIMRRLRAGTSFPVRASMRFVFALLALTVGLGGPAAGQVRAVPDSREQIQLSFAPLVRRASPAVVNVITKRVVAESQKVSPLLDDPFFRRFFGDGIPREPREREQGSVGSGVVVSPEGLIVTNHHVIAGADEIRVILSDRREFDAELVRDDEQTDLAILRVDTGGKPLPWLELANSDELAVGDLVLAIGNPFGVGQTVTSGIISGLARTNVGIADFNFFIQTDAAINPGNSGGALITMDGALAGVNTAIFSKSGGNQGIGFAIPANMVRSVVASVGGGPRLIRPWLGAAVQNLDASISQALGLERPFGVLVTRTHPDGPARRAGLKQGDIIVSVNGQPVGDIGALRFRIATAEMGSEAELTVQRDDRSTLAMLDIEPPPEEPARDEAVLDGRQPLAGATVVNLSPAVASEYGLSVLDTGVVLTNIEPASPARRFGFRPLDRIETVNGTAIERVADLRALLAKPVKQWTFKVLRDGKQFSVSLPG